MSGYYRAARILMEFPMSKRVAVVGSREYPDLGLVREFPSAISA